MTLAQKFSSAMNGIDDEFIEEALTYERSKKRTSSRALRIVLVAALISVLLFTSTLALSPSFRVNTLNTLIEISSDHLTISFDGEEAPLSRTPVRSTAPRWKGPIAFLRSTAIGPAFSTASDFSAAAVRKLASMSPSSRKP